MLVLCELLFLGVGVRVDQYKKTAQIQISTKQTKNLQLCIRLTLCPGPPPLSPFRWDGMGWHGSTESTESQSSTAPGTVSFVRKSFGVKNQ